MPSGNIKEIVNLGKSIENATTFGATKKLHETKVVEPFDSTQEVPLGAQGEEIAIKFIKKAEPFDDAQSRLETNIFDEEEIEIPIRMVNKPKEEIEKPKEPIFPAEIELELGVHKKKRGISFVNLSDADIPAELLNKIPLSVAKYYQLAPIFETAESLMIAMADPADLDAIETVKKIVKKPVNVSLATSDDILAILGKHQKNSANIELEKSQNPTDLKPAKLISDLSPVNRIVSAIFKRAIRDNASDIYIEPAENELLIRFRIDGIIYKKISLTNEIGQAVLAKIKLLANLDNKETRLPQSGTFEMPTEGKKIGYHVATMPIAGGEKVAISVTDKSVKIPNLNDLDFRQTDTDLIKNTLKKPRGLILISGMSSKSKKQLIYALTEELYVDGTNVIGIESQINTLIPRISQSQINLAINYTYKTALESALAQKPDVIVVDEIADKHIVETLIKQAAEKGIVLTAIASDSVTSAVSRLIKTGIEPFLISSALNLVIYQKTVRKICDECKEEITLSSEELSRVKQEIDQLPRAEKDRIRKSPLKFFKGLGCQKCQNTGYFGNINLYEIMPIDSDIKELIEDKAKTAQIDASAVKNGMLTLVQDGIIKVLNSSTTVEEIYR
jgi:type II secretory ATPase GspE/PulE/Tfp pilus assembly ATPase PilB-like protein